MADPKGHPRGPNSFIFMEFSARSLQNNPTLIVGDHSPPPRPGSATANDFQTFFDTDATAFRTWLLHVSTESATLNWYHVIIDINDVLPQIWNSV